MEHTKKILLKGSMYPELSEKLTERMKPISGTEFKYHIKDITLHTNNVLSITIYREVKRIQKEWITLYIDIVQRNHDTTRIIMGNDESATLKEINETTEFGLDLLSFTIPAEVENIREFIENIMESARIKIDNKEYIINKMGKNAMNDTILIINEEDKEDKKLLCDLLHLYNNKDNIEFIKREKTNEIKIINTREG
jgi:hypothetical protein